MRRTAWRRVPPAPVPWPFRRVRSRPTRISRPNTTATRLRRSSRKHWCNGDNATVIVAVERAGSGLRRCGGCRDRRGGVARARFGDAGWAGVRDASAVRRSGAGVPQRAHGCLGSRHHADDVPGVGWQPATAANGTTPPADGGTRRPHPRHRAHDRVPTPPAGGCGATAGLVRCTRATGGGPVFRPRSRLDAAEYALVKGHCSQLTSTGLGPAFRGIDRAWRGLGRAVCGRMGA